MGQSRERRRGDAPSGLVDSSVRHRPRASRRRPSGSRAGQVALGSRAHTRLLAVLRGGRAGRARRRGRATRGWRAGSARHRRRGLTEVETLRAPGDAFRLRRTYIHTVSASGNGLCCADWSGHANPGARAQAGASRSQSNARASMRALPAPDIRRGRSAHCLVTPLIDPRRREDRARI